MFLYFGLDEMTENADASLIAQQLMENVRENDWKLTTGFIGVSALLPALSEHGQMDAAMRLLEQEECPSWLYSVNQGATTTWERWDSYTIDNGFKDNAGMNSFNHYAYGAVGEWMMSGLLGIHRDENSPGFTHFTLNPQFGGTMTHAGGSYDSVSGTIESAWTINPDSGAFKYEITVPANTTATVFLPGDNLSNVTESGSPVADAEGVKSVKYDNVTHNRDEIAVEVGSGTYSFTVSDAPGVPTTAPTVSPSEAPTDTPTGTPAAPTDAPEIVFDDTGVSVKNATEGVLIIAGYDNNGALVKIKTADEYSDTLEGFESCEKVNAFLWDSISTMKPLCKCGTKTITATPTATPTPGAGGDAAPSPTPTATPTATPAHAVSKESTDVDAVKFTHKEWTGAEYTDVNGSTVKGADVYEINREESGMFASTSVVYDTVENAITGARDYKKDASKYVQFLTGENAADWSLVVLQNQDLAQGDAYKDFYQPTYTPNAQDNWKSNLQLPCSWTRQGFDFSIYTNIKMPWQSSYDGSVRCPNAPTVYNPVGLYRKTFKVSDDMRAANGRIYLSFQGVESAYYVYVNGKEVGYSEDSYSPHSFDVTDYLNDGNEDNLLAVKVHKFCDGTWMEDQDMFYDGGIFRDVYLYSAPLIHIQDYKVETDLDENYENARLKLDVTVANASVSAVSGYQVDAKLYDEEGNVFVDGITLNPAEIAGAADGIDGKKTVTAEKTVTAPKLWSAETPNLYTLVLSVYDSAEKAYMGSVSQQLGFREIEFVSSQVDENGQRTTQDLEYKPITINGKPLLFKGTNRHDTDPVYGKFVPKETQEEDVRLMKQYNINAIRTSHYSNDEYLYYLCDKYGLYMMAETNLESHALMRYGDDQKNFKSLAMDRTVTAFNRLKNRTAVVAWSTGNENHYNTDKDYADGMFYDLIWYFKNNDSTRPVHCESSNYENGVDMGARMYKSVDEVQARVSENMPYVLSEYSHAMGNSVGNLKEYWDVIRSSDNMLGGFIWDWVDQSRLLSLDTVSQPYDYYAQDYAHKNLYKEEAVGNYYCYGGDNGESPNDSSFCVNGLVSPDRDVQPELYEVKYQYQSIWFDATDLQLIKGTVKAYNENNFLNLNDFDVKWTLTEDADVIGSGTLTDTDLAGRESKLLSVPYRELLPNEKKAGAEYYLKLSVQLKEDTLWAKAGHEVAYEQFQIPADVAQAEKTADTNVVVDKTGDDVIVVSGRDFSFQIDKSTGAIKNYVYGEETLLNEGPVPNYWRAPVNNDNANYDENWQNVNKGITASEITTGTNENGQTTITVKLSSPAQEALKQTMVYTVDGSGAVTVDMTVNATETELGRYMRIGTVMELPEGCENVEWYGNGPVEAMWDREDFAVVDRYRSTVSEMFYPYLDTQDTGTVTGVKWITVTDPSKTAAMAIAAADKVEASALHFTADDLTQAHHPYELTKLDTTILTVNYRSQGTGNMSCGPDTLPAYLLPNDKAYSFSYTMVPYTTEGADVMELTRAYRTVWSVTEQEIEDAEPSNMFGTEHKVINNFDDKKSLAETAIGDTGFKVSTSSSNYNNVVVMSNATKATAGGYYPYGSGLPDRGYYLFFGSGGNGSVSATLTLPETVPAGKYIKIIYAKPYATNDGRNNRNQDNSADDKITVGTEVIDLKASCDFDKWYTTTVKVNDAVTKLDISLGKWGAMAISDIKILDSTEPDS